MTARRPCPLSNRCHTIEGSLLTKETHLPSRYADHRSACATPTTTSWGLCDECAERHGRPSERRAVVRTSPEVVPAAVLSQTSWPALRWLHTPNLARPDKRQSKHRLKSKSKRRSMKQKTPRPTGPGVARLPQKSMNDPYGRHGPRPNNNSGSRDASLLIIAYLLIFAKCSGRLIYTPHSQKCTVRRWKNISFHPARGITLLNGCMYPRLANVNKRATLTGKHSLVRYRVISARRARMSSCDMEGDAPSWPRTAP